MIFVTGFGQMCNNILQFGHICAWGKERSVPVIAMRFCYKYPFFAINRKKHYHWFTYLFAKYGTKLGMIPKVSFMKEEDVNPENTAKLLASKFVLTEGWFMRDYEAFLRCRNEIKELFVIKKEIRERVDALLPKSEQAAIRLGVHLRRGDYKTWLNGNYYYSDEDYIRIIQSFMSLFSENEIEVLVVSNEKKISCHLFKNVLNTRIHFLSGNPGEDLYALSTCNYLIGPPSTFSLMAAFYRDLDLYWIFDKTQELRKDSFKKFDYLFRRII
jgi:hypothetical protein